MQCSVLCFAGAWPEICQSTPALASSTGPAGPARQATRTPLARPRAAATPGTEPGKLRPPAPPGIASTRRAKDPLRCRSPPTPISCQDLAQGSRPKCGATHAHAHTGRTRGGRHRVQLWALWPDDCDCDDYTSRWCRQTHLSGNSHITNMGLLVNVLKGSYPLTIMIDNEEPLWELISYEHYRGPTHLAREPHDDTRKAR